ncbi:MAG TPA: YgiQ family radical SAM protein [Deltaproteobacteria bacterium]|nr:YgiQ family radical SAM protein [Deltaproteobacteria bacterium]HPR55008.1 YgiQ family radical SAM protein [Deltaproteobacteria bacterium]HXK46345.1 YgiQ family radical SAM protein [Deltaproteobacteria bacterium]
MFLPATREEMNALGWDRLDVVLVTGDAYIDSPHIGVAVVGKALLRVGFRVGVVSQPDTSSDMDILRLGEPALFWGVTGGSIDSMVANYTPLKKRRKSDDYTPGGMNTRRPDRAVIVYTNLIRRFSRSRAPVVLGGIEASLRRIAHYDFWSDAVRRSILFDAKADIIVYGMAENPVVELARRISSGKDHRDLRGICFIGRDRPDGYEEIPSYEDVSTDMDAFQDMFHAFARNNDPATGVGFCQRHGDRFLIHNPPWPVLAGEELDDICALEFEREVHPRDRALGEVKAMETIRFSITTHRGCLGRCNFCSIGVHEGTVVVSRSEASILLEAERIAGHPRFKGIIRDVGGPTANMYGMGCTRGAAGSCRDRRCLYPGVCPALDISHERQTGILKRLRAIPGIRKAFVASGIRHDLVCSDVRHGDAYLEELTAHHVSGQLKLAPEHCIPAVLDRMAKPGTDALLTFRDAFSRLNRLADRKQFLTYYFLAAHPGCTEEDMKRLRAYIDRHLKLTPEQVQIFTPTPSTYSTLMYCTGRDPFTGEHIFVERDPRRKQRQKDILTERKGKAGNERRSQIR